MNHLSDNDIAAFLDGNANPELTMQVIEAAKCNDELRQFLELSRDIDEDITQDCCASPLPYAEMAAMDSVTNKCAILCELYVLEKFGIQRSPKDWETQARNQGWLTPEGMAMFNIGRLLEKECLSVSRTFDNALSDIERAMAQGKQVITVVDGKELTTDGNKQSVERLEDAFIGIKPNHAVVVTAIDKEKAEISLYDPNGQNGTAEYALPMSAFEDAWQDSSHFMIAVNKRDFSLYEPRPIDLSDVELPEDLSDLREAIAENAHEIWAQGRKKRGWTYGPKRDDVLKQTPDMVPYSDLKEEEKYFDREMAINTIKLLRKLGYRIIKE